MFVKFFNDQKGNIERSANRRCACDKSKNLSRRTKLEKDNSFRIKKQSHVCVVFKITKCKFTKNCRSVHTKSCRSAGFVETKAPNSVPLHHHVGHGIARGSGAHLFSVKGKPNHPRPLAVKGRSPVPCSRTSVCWTQAPKTR